MSNHFAHVPFSRSCNGVRLWGPDVAIEYRRCKGCYFLFAPEMMAWSAEQFVNTIYNSDYIAVDPDFIQVRPMANAAIIAQQFGGFPSIDILDYGTGGGLFVEEMATRGFSSIKGYEPFNFDHYSTPPRQDERFDLITAFEVVEHVPDQITLFGTLAGLRKADGLILFSTLLQPDGVDGSWSYIAPRNGHLAIHSTESLQILGRILGLKVRSNKRNNLHFIYESVPAFAPFLV